MNDGKLVLDNTTPGENYGIRKKLASLLNAQDSGHDPLEQVLKWGSIMRKKVIGFLIDQLDEEEITHTTSRVLFQFLANAENAA